MLFAFLIAIVVMFALMAAFLAIHMSIRSGEARPSIKYDQVHEKVHVHKLHDVIFANETEDERIALPV